MVFTELCFADDVSVPQLPLLIRQEEIENETAEINRKEELIDNLIKLKSIPYFHPSKGPVDPAISTFRHSASNKVLRGLSGSEQVDSEGALAIFFNNIPPDMDDTLPQIKSSFPLTENKIDEERFAGANIFRKRQLEETESNVEKKPKVEAVVEESAEKESIEDSKEIDDLVSK